MAPLPTKPKIKKRTQKQCDALLTPLIKLLNPYCMLCGQSTQVAHHHVHKSKSLVLRYNIDNLIPLCNGCHFKLHLNESYWASKIVETRGIEWFQYLDKEKNKIIKPNYNEIYEALKERTKQAE
jgi:hypothetical protein